ncbi:hypothetical protein GcC1_114017 [Golovinomyces cichoracearum]|uniref:Uncharacterized protein n=1 Tax=Golovinomyces cichoracearum TaxID=62708 RepID=A0A420I887_9PEZI|nr:hypothetical protein GcC1_114017 [Golovinomyces cichoracearum]
MIQNIIAIGLVKFLKTDDDKPSVDLSNWQSLKSSELDKISEWVKGNTKAANTIMYNCNSGPQAIITNYHTAAEMWNALEQAYEASGIDQVRHDEIRRLQRTVGVYHSISEHISASLAGDGQH